MSAPLRIELVPSTAWWSNVRSQVTRKQWEVCKAFVKTRSGGRCEICGGVGRRWPVECHERWQYDDNRMVQTLVGLIALCPTCHAATHIGRTIRTSGVDNVNRVLAHVAKVNHWSTETTHRAVQNAFGVWSIRSAWEWDLDVSWLATIGLDLPQYVWSAQEKNA